ncbi:hypothetical protein Golob_023452 [Gossypium lobatum]|uniref:Uncharacterized protein n=1 Tax=Gossypium lobatum TaxID=34289 RepID=A0A7J8LJU3_9ROSI|nr:hypothetical protein [Gossypium lobatum]
MKLPKIWSVKAGWINSTRSWKLKELVYQRESIMKIYVDFIQLQMVTL